MAIEPQRKPKKWPPKDPEDVLEYGFNWSPLGLGDDTITATSATVIEGDVVVDNSEVGAVANAKTGQGTIHWLSGGTAGTTSRLKLHVTTAAGREIDQTVDINVQER